MEAAPIPKAEREVTLDSWQQLGVRLEQKKAGALQALDSVLVPRNIPSLSQEELSQLAPEQKLKAVLTGIDLRLESGNFLQDENYRYLLFDLATLPGDKRKTMLVDTGLGDMLTYHTVEALRLVGDGSLRIHYDSQSLTKFIHDRHCTLAIGRHFATDKALTDIYDSDQLITVVGDKLKLGQPDRRYKGLYELASQFVAEAVLHNPHTTREQIRGLLAQETITTQMLITSLAEAGKRKWHSVYTLSEEMDYLNGFRLAPGLVCHDLSELSRIAKFHEDATPIIEALDRDMQQAVTPERKAKVFDEYANFIQAGNICPPLKQKFEILDALFLHDLLPSDQPEINIRATVAVEITIQEALDTLEWNWGRFLRRFTAKAGEVTSPTVHFDREKYEAAKLRDERRIIAAHQMDEALRADMRRPEIEEGMLAKRGEVTTLVPIISDAVKNTADRAKKSARDFGIKGSLLKQEDPEPGNTHTWLIGDTAIPRLVLGFDLKDIDLYTTDSITKLQAGGGRAEFQQTADVIRSLAEKGQLPPVEAFLWLSDAGAQLLEVHAANPYLTNSMFQQLLRGYINQIEAYLDQVVVIDQSFAERLSGSRGFLKRLKEAVPKLNIDQFRLSPYPRKRYMELMESEGVISRSSTALRNIFLPPEYYRRYVPNGNKFAMTHGLPASIMHTDITDKAVEGYDIVKIISQDPNTLVPVDVEVPKAGILLVLGPNNAGKTTLGKAVADSVKRAEYGEVPLFCLSMTRPENPNGPAISRASTPAETTLTQSLFSSHCESLSELILSTLRYHDELPPVILRLDEWGLGTDDIARVCILYSTLLHIRQIHPDLSVLLITHEGEEFFTLDRLLRLQEANREILPPMQTLVLNPLTRRGTYERLGGSLASIAVSEVDPEMASLAQGLEEMRRAGFTSYDMREVEQRYEGEETPSATFTNRVDLERMEFDEGNLGQGDFAAIKFCLDALNVGIEADRRSLTRFFSRIFMDAATGSDPQELAYLRSAVSKFRALSEGNLQADILPAIMEIASVGNQLFADRLNTKEFSRLVDLISDPDIFRKHMLSLVPVLGYLQTDPAEINAFHNATESLANNFSQAIDKLADELRSKLQTFFIQSTVDIRNLASDLETARELEIDTDELQLLSKTNPALTAELKSTREGVSSFLLSLLNAERYADFTSLVNIYTSPELESEKISNMLGITKEKGVPLDARTIADCRFMDIMVGLTEKPVMISSLKLFPTFMAESKRFETIIGSIKTKDLMPAGVHQTFSYLAKSVRALVYGATAAVFTAPNNALGIKWTVPTIKERDDEFPVAFENGRNPAVVHALRDSGTPYIEMEFDLAKGKSGNRHNTVLLSGPNFEGKTSQMILALKMAVYQQMFDLVPAERATLSPIDYVAISVNAFIPDPEAGVGSLLAQAVDLRRILNKARASSRKGKKGLVAGDELWLGTESRGRTDLQAASIYQLATIPGLATIYATHDTQLDATLNKINAGTESPIRYTHISVGNHRPLYGDKGQSQPYKILGRVLQNRGVPSDLARSIISTSQELERMLRNYNTLVQNA